MTVPMLRPLLRKWARSLVLGLTLLSVLGMTGLLVEQVAGLVLHGYVGHDLPGERARHAHEEQCPSHVALHGECHRAAVAAGALAEARRVAPDAAWVIRPAESLAPTPSRGAVPTGWRPADRSTGPPHRPPIA